MPSIHLNGRFSVQRCCEDYIKFMWYSECGDVVDFSVRVMMVVVRLGSDFRWEIDGGLSFTWTVVLLDFRWMACFQWI